MENLLASGIAAYATRRNVISLASHSECMLHTTDRTLGSGAEIRHVLRILDSHSELIAQLSAPERLLARSIRERMGVSE